MTEVLPTEISLALTKSIAINFIVLSPNKTKLALVREFVSISRAEKRFKKPSNFIEVYHVTKHAPTFVKSFIEIEQINGLDWVDDNHLVSGTNYSTINVYSSRTGSKVIQDLTDFGPITALKVDRENKLIFTGTEYGYVCIYKYDLARRRAPLFMKMQNVNEPITSIDFRVVPISKSEKTDGDNGNDSDEGEQPKYDITTYGASGPYLVVWMSDKVEKIKVSDNDECPVWTILALQNGDIVCGDKSGRLSIYETENFTCKQYIKALDADILCLTKNSGETELACSGKDPTIRKLQRHSNGDWLLTNKINMHERDVRSLVFLNPDNLFSGGLDSSLALSKLVYPNNVKTLIKFIVNPDHMGQIDAPRPCDVQKRSKFES